MKTLFTRNGKTIKDLTTTQSHAHLSINAAKRMSRVLQHANGGLGCGSMVVLK
jgi:hypothetical protein